MLQLFPSHRKSGFSTGAVAALHGYQSDNGFLYVPTPIAVAGTFTGLRITTTVAPGAGTSWTLTLRVNGSTTALTATVADSATTGTGTGSIAVAVGDRIDYQCSASGSPAAAALAAALEFTATDANVAVYAWAGRTVNENGIIAPAAFGEHFVDVANGYGDQALFSAGTITAWSVAIETTFGGGPSQNIRFVLRKNGVDQDGTGGTSDTTITCTGGSLVQSATVSLSVAAGDRLAVRCLLTGSIILTFSGSLRFEGAGLQLQVAGHGPSSTTRSFLWVTGSGTDGTQLWSTPESARQDVSGVTALTLRGLRAARASAGSDVDQTVTLRVNGVDTALSLTLTDASPSGEVTGSVTVAPGDLLSYGLVGSSGGGGDLYLALFGSGPPRVGCLVAGVDTDIAATRAISFGLDGDSHVDTRDGTFTVHGDTWLDGETEIEGDTLIHGDLEVEGDTLFDGDVTVLGTLTAPGVPGAPTDAAYVTLSPDSELSAERVLTGSGRVSVTDGGSTVTLDVPNDGITYAKIQNVTAASRLLGRGSSGGSGDVEELTLGTGLTLTGTTLSASGSSGSSHYDCPLSDGDLTAAEIIFASGECVIVQVPV